MNLNLNQMSELASSSSQESSGLSAKLKSCSYLLLLLLLSAASCVVLPSCSSSTATAADNNSNLSTSLTLEKAATVPVLDGKATQAGVYIHNNTGQSISGIQYASVITGTSQGQSVNNQLLQLNLNNCTTIAANSSCLLSFSTPILSLGQSGSSLIDASYNGQHSKQLINYRYYSSNDYTGVNFSDGSSTLYGTNDYATVYAFVGKSQSQTKVGFNASNPSLAVSSGLTNGSVDIASNQVVALEIKSNQAVTSNLVSLTPYTVTTFKQLANSLQSANLQNQNLQVTINPTQQANLLMSDSPILNATGESSATITLINNGNQTATNINLTSADSAKVTVTSASSNPCTSGGSLAAGASCNYKLSLVDLYNNGQSSLNLAYNNRLTSINISQTVSYYNNLAAPMVSVVPTSSSFSENINTANTQVFNVQNIGNAPLSNLGVSLSKTLTQATLSQTNDCGVQIKAKASCTITAMISANANVDSGIFYAKLNGSFNNGSTTTNYSFVSKPVSTTITDPTIATISSTTPQTAAIDVSVATSIALSFSKAMDPTTLNATNIQLQKVSDSSSVSLTFQGVTNNNQTVTFTQTSGNLSDLTDYKIVVNPSAIKDYNGNSMGQTSTQTAASFTTGNNVVIPTIGSVNPSTGTSNQSKTPTINISFSVPMNPATLTTSNIMLKTAAGVIVAGTAITITNSDQNATVNLNSTPLADSTTYQLVLNEVNLTSSTGGAMGTNPAYVATSFTTGDFTAPTLSGTIPLNGATGVAVESPISLTFSEAMDTATLTTTTVKLQKVSDSSYVSLNNPSFSNVNQTVTFQPSASLSVGETYNLVINQSAIKDVAGNAMGVAISQTVSNFTVKSIPAVTISPIANWTTMMGSTYTFTASISSGSSTVIPILFDNSIGDYPPISPTSCNLNSAVSGSESCVFVVDVGSYLFWAPASYVNSGNIAAPTVIVNDIFGLQVTAPDGAVINGGSSTLNINPLAGTTTVPYVYLAATESGALNTTTNITGITWGAGGSVTTRFSAATSSTGAACTQIESDNLTGLSWIKSPSIQKYNWSATAVAGSAQDYITTLNGAGVCGYKDWRLPTVTELRSLINYAASSPASWLNASGFSSVQANNISYYWSSSAAYASALGPNSAWVVLFLNGSVSAANKTSTTYVWPVRGGQ
ncbi:MAG: Ig-like domain-containing protein [Burkholderiales bacterium]|nr:Ig-like domain-containing protein [Burkholderiales bacterium]